MDYELIKEGFILDDNSLLIDLRFSGFGVVDREIEGTLKKILRNKDCFNDFDLAGIPILLEHPKDNLSKNALISKDISFETIGSIVDTLMIRDNEIRVKARFFDPYFIDYFLANKDLIQFSTSPAVMSELLSVENQEYDFVEKIISIDHLAFLVESVGFWDSYVASESVSQNKINNNNLLLNNINEVLAMPVLEKETTSETPLVDSEIVKEEEIKENSTLEEAKEIANEVLEKIENKAMDDKLIEEIQEETKIETPKADDIVSEIVEEVKENLHNDDLILDDFETQSDLDREMVIKLVSNLVDSVEGFRKPYFKDRIKAGKYLSKTLCLNKAHIDKKYHSILDSIDDSSLELGLEILASIDKAQKKTPLKENRDLIQVSQNRFIQKIY